MGVMLHGEYEIMYQAEERHWWYRGLHDQVLSALDATPEKTPGGVLDAGCGTGRMLQLLADRQAFGFDLSAEALRLAGRRAPGRLALASALEAPVASGSVAVCLSLDVLSNLPPEKAPDMLRELFRVLTPGGRLVLNTASGQWLFGAHDRAVGVRKRYSLEEVRSLLRQTGFEVEVSSRSNCLLFPMAALYRLGRRLLPAREREPSSDIFQLPRPLDNLLFAARWLENRLILKLGLPLPFGLSVFAVARKPAKDGRNAACGGPAEADRAAMFQAVVSVVIPVYNAQASIGPLCRAVRAALPCRGLQIVLVNDGSRDASHEACLAARREAPGIVTYLRLSRNFGEHNAVMAGLREARGDFTIILDDDFQNPPGEAPRLLAHCIQRELDVVYGAFRVKRHALWRNAGSRFNGLMAGWLLGKPKGLYLSSFKCLSRFAREQATAYRGPNPYLDGLLLRVTDRIGQVDVEHAGRTNGQSGYTLRKLLNLWMNMFLPFSPIPARIAACLGAATVLGGLAGMITGFFSHSITWAVEGLGAGLAGLALTAAGLSAEYAARALAEVNAAPQYVVRERFAGSDSGGAGHVAPPDRAPREVP